MSYFFNSHKMLDSPGTNQKIDDFEKQVHKILLSSKSQIWDVLDVTINEASKAIKAGRKMIRELGLDGEDKDFTKRMINRLLDTIKRINFFSERKRGKISLVFEES